MAAGNVARILRAPGRIVIDPNNLAGAFPYGGTEIGKSNLCVLQPLGTTFRVEYEALGEFGDILESNRQYVMTFFLRGFDDDAVEQMLNGGYELGATTRHALFHEPGLDFPGTSALDRGLMILYVPDDVINVPALLVYRGIPGFPEGAEIAFQRGTELGIPIAVDCLRDDAGNMIRIGRIADLSLS